MAWKHLLPVALAVMVYPARAASTEPASIVAFPGAEGFGAYSQGGRGGTVYRVTNLSNSGTGSLRDAINASGPRIVVFDVSGTIELTSSLTINNPYITIAGQTAPGEGITMRNYPFGVSADHVIIRYVRSRLGDETNLANGREDDSMNVTEGEHVIIDHCSASWSMDECLSVSTADPVIDHVTVQWCFISEALNRNDHSYGSLIRGTEDAKYTYHHNLYAHNRSRNPRPGNYNTNPYTEDPLGLLLDFRNNVIYNWIGNYPGYNADTDSVTRMNYVGNYVYEGPDSGNNTYMYLEASHHNTAYFAGNYFNHTLPGDPYSLVRYSSGNPDAWTQSEIDAYEATPEFAKGTIDTQNADDAYDDVLLYAGALFPARDSVDLRIIDETIDGNAGGIIDSQTEVGGWPALATGTPATDSDGDGMADDWETQQGLNPASPADGPLDADGDGYTNVEEYLNALGLWTALEGVWIDFGYDGAEAGTEAKPFDGLREGIGYVVQGELLKVKAGTTSEAFRITQPVRIEAVGGTVRIGG
jgi:pectate lyase